MADAMKPGDVVQLKSGGPIMTVTDADTVDGVSTIWTVWFDQSKKEQRSHFPAATVQIYTGSSFG